MKFIYWLLLKIVLLFWAIEHDEKRFLFCKFVCSCPGVIMLFRDAEQANEAGAAPSCWAPRLLRKSFKKYLIKNKWKICLLLSF